MFLCLELFHPGKVTSFSHRLVAVPLNLALVPQSVLCSGVECLPVGHGDGLLFSSEMPFLLPGSFCGCGLHLLPGLG